MALVTLTQKVYTETKELYDRIKEETESKTADEFVSLLLENWQNPKKVLHRKEDLEQIEHLQTEISKLQEQIKGLQEENTALENNNRDIAEINDNLQAVKQFV